MNILHSIIYINTQKIKITMHRISNRSIHANTFYQGTTYITVSKRATHYIVFINSKKHQWLIINFIYTSNCVNDRKGLRNYVN